MGLSLIHIFLHVDDAALPRGTTLAVADLFFNTPARRKFLRAESTELAHVTALVTHYALAHPEKHFELVSATHTIVSAPPVARTAERIYQIFGKDTLAQLLPVAAETPLAHAGLPDPPPWKRDSAQPARDPGVLRLTGFYSRPELQKLNRNSIYIFVNKRLIRDRLLLHAITEAYRNVIPPTSFPVVLLFLEMPPEEMCIRDRACPMWRRMLPVWEGKCMPAREEETTDATAAMIRQLAPVCSACGTTIVGHKYSEVGSAFHRSNLVRCV